MKIAILSIPSLLSATILRAFQDKDMQCKYLGLDRQSRLIMEIRYNETDEVVIKEQINLIESTEKLIYDVFSELEKLCKEANQKAAELKRERQKTFNGFNNFTTKDKQDGNEQQQDIGK